MPKKQFELPDDKRAEPIEFALGDQWFRCEDEIPAAASFALMSCGPIEGTMRFLTGVVVEEDTERFLEVTGQKGRGRVVTEAVLAEVLAFVVDGYTDRPTSPPSNSPGGRQATSTASEANSPSTAAESQ